MINTKFYLIALHLVFSSIFSNISGQDSLNIKQLNNNLTLQNVQLNPDTFTNKLPQFNPVFRIGTPYKILTTL